MTYRLRMEALGRQLDRERHRDAWMVWHIAALARVAKGKLPSIDDLAGIKRVVAKQTATEMKSIFAAMREAAA